jgi:chromosome segregation ATPase
MKTSLLCFVVLSLVSCRAIAAEAPPPDPAAEYLEAFLAIQDGDAAVKQTDWTIANKKFADAQRKLTEIKAAAPTWNPQMVDFRLRYCTEQLDAIAPKLPQKAPPLEATITAPPPPPKPVEPPVAPPVAPPPAEPVVEVKPVPPPEPVARPEDLEQIKALRDQLAKVQDSADKASAQTKELTQQNQDLSTQLAEARKQAATPPPVTNITPAPPAVDDSKLKDLQAQIAKSEADAARARKQADELAQQNSALRTKLSAAAKPAPATPPAPAEGNRGYFIRTGTDAELRKQNASLAEELKKLQNELAAANQQTAKARKANTDLQQQNRQLATRLSARKSEQPAKPGNRGYLVGGTAATNAPAVDRLQQENAMLLAELQKTRTALAKVRIESTNLRTARDKDTEQLRTETEQGRKAAAEPQKLRGENQELTAKVAALQKQADAARATVTPARPAMESAEVAKLRAELQKTRDEAERSQKSGDSRVAELTKQNQQLSAALAAAQKPTAAPRDGDEVRQLRAALAAAKADAEEAKRGEKRVATLEAQNAELRAQLAAAQKQPPAPREPADLRKLRTDLDKLQTTVNKNAEMMEQLRRENSFLKNLLDTYAARNPELKGQLRRLPSATK